PLSPYSDALLRWNRPGRTWARDGERGRLEGYGSSVGAGARSARAGGLRLGGGRRRWRREQRVERWWGHERRGEERNRLDRRQRRLHERRRCVRRTTQR